jgi:hypothetical protein
MAHDLTHPNDAPRQRRFTIGACVLLAIAAFYLWTEHRAHLLGALPYVLLLACPAMHLFMHHGHGKHGSPSAHEHHHPEGQ